MQMVPSSRWWMFNMLKTEQKAAIATIAHPTSLYSSCVQTATCLLGIALLPSAFFPHLKNFISGSKKKRSKNCVRCNLWNTLSNTDDCSDPFLAVWKTCQSSLQNVSFNKFSPSQKTPGFPWDKSSYLLHLTLIIPCPAVHTQGEHQMSFLPLATQTVMLVQAASRV